MRLAPRFSVASSSHLGRHANNEDFHRAVAFRLPMGHLLLVDGMGGREAGEGASRLAIEAFKAIRAYADQIGQGRRVVSLAEALEQAFALARRRDHLTAVAVREVG